MHAGGQRFESVILHYDSLNIIYIKIFIIVDAFVALKAKNWFKSININKILLNYIGLFI